jgi:hypothetical protein
VSNESPTPEEIRKIEAETQKKALFIQTSANLVTIGTAGIIAASFLTGQEFLANYKGWKSPVIYFMVGGLFLISSGAFLLWHYHKDKSVTIFTLYEIFYYVGLVSIGFAAIVTLIWFYISHPWIPT